MKRKRGSKGGFKKGKKKGIAAVSDPTPSPSPSPSHLNVDEDVGLDEDDDSQQDLKNGVELLPSVASDEKGSLANSEPVVANETPVGKSGYGRVKVKLKSSRLLGPPNAYADAQASETDKSNVQVVSPMPDLLVERKEGSNYSDGQSSDLQPSGSGKSPRKAGSIKIISSRGLGSSNVAMPEKHVYKVSSPLQMIGVREPGLSDNEKTADSSVSRKLYQREVESPSHYNKSELSAALVVIKKVMNMDAAEPFNAPVDPIALGIPDYFDIIETPMDFGTIRKDLEHRRKYFNSKGVYKDVQFIWENCYKYNNKGDYILDLMKRVKRNFMKYWVAAGLYSDLPGHMESTHIEDVTQSGKQKLYLKLKGKSSKHKRKRHGIDLHKNGCLCAVCVVRRRRKEREGTSVTTDRQTPTFEDNLPQELRQEKGSPIENILSEHTSSSLDQSPEPDMTEEVEPDHDEMFASPGQPDDARLVKQEIFENEGPRTISNDGRPCGHPVEDETQMSNQPFEEQELVPDSAVPPDDQKGTTVSEQNVQLHLEVENEEMGSPESSEQISVYEDPLRRENSAILQICGTLFTNNPRSVWRGPHSLNPRPVLARSSPVHAALSMFMKR